nr:MAG TPA: hypothetical protein [Caudoviricetes sp.]
MLDENFLTELLGKEDVSTEDKIKSILAEKDAGERALIQKRDELLGNEVKLKKRISEYESSNGEYEAKITSLNDLLEKANKGDEVTKQQYEAKIADLDKQSKKSLKEISDSRDSYKKQYLDALFSKSIEDGIKELDIIPGLKDGFIARITSMNNFEPNEMNGKTVFLDKDNHTIGEVVNSFVMTSEGKAYIRNAASGGGAAGSAPSGYGNDKQLTSQQIENMNDQQLMEFALKGGKVVD